VPQSSESYTFHYPNARSYNQLPVSKQHDDFHWQGRSLRHGYIIGYKSLGTDASQVGGILEKIGGWFSPGSSTRRPDFDNIKMFQFNPSALNISVGMMNTDPPETELQGQNLPGTAVGYASTELRIFFDRTYEVARSNNGHGSSKWRDLGVQWDIFDLLTVIAGGNTGILAQAVDATDPDTPGGGTVRAGSTNHMTGMFLDASVTGSKIMFMPFAIVFNPNLSVHVLQMSSFSFSYIRFTSDLVPTTVEIVMSLVIANMGSRSYVTSGGSAGASPTVDGGSSTSAPPGTTASSDFGNRPAQGVY
jgi:hypothetical protein